MQVIADARGTGSSEGTWDSFGPREREDGFDLAEWTRSPAVERRPGRPARHLIRRDQPVPHRRAAAAGGQGRVPDRADVGRLPRRDVRGRTTDTSFIPLWLGLVTGLGVLPPTYSPSDPAEAAKVLVPAHRRRAVVPGLPGARLDDRRERRLRRPLLPGAIADRHDLPRPRPDVRGRRLVRPVPARRAAALPGARAPARPDPPADGALVPHHRRQRAARRRRAHARRARAAVDGPLRQGNARPRPRQQTRRDRHDRPGHLLRERVGQLAHGRRVVRERREVQGTPSCGPRPAAVARDADRRRRPRDPGRRHAAAQPGDRRVQPLDRPVDGWSGRWGRNAVRDRRARQRRDQPLLRPAGHPGPPPARADDRAAVDRERPGPRQPRSPLASRTSRPTAPRPR